MEPLDENYFEQIEEKQQYELSKADEDREERKLEKIVKQLNELPL